MNPPYPNVSSMRSERLKFKQSTMRQYPLKRSAFKQTGFDWVQIALLVWIGVLGVAERAAAHHPFGGQTPTNAWEGLLSGLGHPVIGFDHLAFVVAVGLLAANIVRGGFIPVAFLLTAMIGTGMHLLAIDLPMTELAIAGSVVLFGAMVIGQYRLDYKLLTGLAAIAGLFHGYAYGEAIIGAEMNPIAAYLLGFTLMQGMIAFGAMMASQLILKRWTEKASAILQVSGLAICSVGVMFLATAIIG